MTTGFKSIDVTDSDRGLGRFTVEVDRLGEAGWNSLLDGFEDATTYQTWAYGAVSWGEEHLSHLVLRRGEAAVAAAQLRIVRVPVLHSGIAYVRWGPLCVPRGSDWNSAVCRSMLEALIQEYVVRRGFVLRVIPNIFLQDAQAQAIAEILSDLGMAEEVAVKKYHTMRVDLTPATEVLREQLSGRWRRQLNIAERNNLEILEGRTDGLYREFLNLYREMMARKQFDTTVNVDEFHRIQQRLPKTQKLMTFICRLESIPVAGLVVDAIGTTAIYLLAATGDSGLNARGSYLLQWRAMQWLKEQGCQWYDLGGINQDFNPGVFTFKSGMGGEAVRQVGAYHLSHSRLSTFSVALGEGARKIVGKLAARRRR